MSPLGHKALLTASPTMWLSRLYLVPTYNCVVLAPVIRRQWKRLLDQGRWRVHCNHCVVLCWRRYAGANMGVKPLRSSWWSGFPQTRRAAAA